ncbi:MAG: NADH-quinone oxidoreductase subunit C/D [Candidatus Hydrogenedentes bacterium]|nr:NADH-quinone oxidoreductase subunit C/D [Candidatus Hydrogenedentota bacterium]
MSTSTLTIAEELQERFGPAVFGVQETRDGIPTIWVDAASIKDIMSFLKSGVSDPYAMLYDLSVIDERVRMDREQHYHVASYTVFYHLVSFGRNEDIRIKVAPTGVTPAVDSITSVFPAANWYEREAWDMYGVRFNGHPNLRRILMPNTWTGHPLRKDHPARATEIEPFQLPDEKLQREQDAMMFRPEEWGLSRGTDEFDYMFLNLGPHHPGTHGLLRIILQLDGEEIVEAIPDIGYHHRGAEKMGERQTWHTFIPYTDRIDYLSGVMNNLAYLLAVEKLAGIEVPPRSQVIRVMMSELFRIASHLVWYGTFAQDLGALSPTFFMFNDREKILGIVEAICGGRMHPSWFRIGGVAHDLPKNWDKPIRDFIAYFPPRIKDYDNALMKNRIFKSRAMGIGAYNVKEAIEWGVTGPGLRACGYDWDFRKKRPYSGFENFEFDVPLAEKGDCYARAQVRIEEMRQSLRIIEQCVNNMPEGAYKSEHPLTTPPRKDRTMHDIETLINHFLNVSWGPIIPAGEAFFGIEASKGAYGYYLISDGNTMSYRTRIRTPSFPHMQMLPLLSRGVTVSDLLAILGSMDYVLADVDR